MGVLDDLKRQADAQRAKEKDATVRSQSDVEFYQQELLPRMQAIYNYFNELCTNLNYVKPEITAHYPVLPDNKLQAFQQGDYKVNIDSSKELKEVIFRFVCSLPQPLQVDVQSKERIVGYSSDLDRYSVKYERKEFKNEQFEVTRGQFIVEGPIMASAVFRADVEQRNIRLQLRHVEKPGMVHHVFKAEQLSNDYLDKLAGYLLRQNLDFMKLDITDAHRDTIRQKVLEEQRYRAAELAEAERIAAEEARLAELETQKKKGLDLKSLSEKGLAELKNLKNWKDLPQLKSLKDLLSKKKT